jgi:hypothetical protein
MAKTLAEIGSLAREQCPSAIHVLKGIMNSKESPESARISASNSLLDRGLGKPAQAIAIKGDPDSPVIFHLRLGDGIAPKVIDGTAEVMPQDSLTGPLVAITAPDEESQPE